MTRRPPLVLSLVERGWRGARECSLDLLRYGVCVTHLVKGRLDPGVRGMIAPRPNVRFISVSRRWFWWAAGWALAQAAWTGRLRSVLVDNERSVRRLSPWARRLGVSLVLVGEGARGYELWHGREPLPRVAWYEQIGAYAYCGDLR